MCPNVNNIVDQLKLEKPTEYTIYRERYSPWGNDSICSRDAIK